jgi:hypothetical protein
MAQYPVEDDAGLFEAVNYLLSGPSGLGQNFNGVSSYTPVYLTNTFRAPYSVPITTTPVPTWYVAPVSISNIVPVNVVDGKTANFEVTFSSAQPTAPFAAGDSFGIRNVVASGGEDYNGYYSRGAILTCSTTTAVIQTRRQYSWATYTSGGEIYKDQTEVLCSTDANARVTVQGPTELVFISSQLQLDVGVTVVNPGTLTMSVQINRYKGFVDTAPGAIDYLFDLDATVSEQVNTYSLTTATTTINAGQNIFTTVLDQPSFGYYWYIAEIEITVSDIADVQPGAVTAGLRSLTAQVIKQ